MGVYFVYRSYYEGPAGRYVKRFPQRSVLQWFRDHWHAEPPDGNGGCAAACARADHVLGCGVSGFYSLFTTVAESALPAPSTGGELTEFLRRWRYPEGEVLVQPGAVQVLTDDDDIELAWYLFDDDFLAKHPERATYLVHEGWRLPAEYGDGGTLVPAAATLPLYPDRQGPGGTYAAFLPVYETGCLSGLEGPFRIDGVRLPDLCACLAGCTLCVGQGRRPKILKALWRLAVGTETDEVAPPRRTSGVA